MRSWPKLHWRQCSHKFLGQPNGNQSRPVVSHDPIPHISLAKMSSVIESVGTTTPKSRHIDSESIHFYNKIRWTPRMVTNMGWPACSRYRCGPHSRHKCPFPRFPLHVPVINDRRPFHLHLKKCDMGKLDINWIYIYIVVGSIQCGWIVTSCQVDLCEARPSWRIAWLNYHLRRRDKCCYNSPAFKRIWLHRRIPLWIGKMLSRKVKGRHISKWDRIVGIHKLQ